MQAVTSPWTVVNVAVQSVPDSESPAVPLALKAEFDRTVVEATRVVKFNWPEVLPAVPLPKSSVPPEARERPMSVHERTCPVPRETVLLNVPVVNEPAAGAVPPIAGGEARYVLKPEPLTVELADRVVNAPPAAEVPPIAGGEAKRVLNPEPVCAPVQIFAFVRLKSIVVAVAVPPTVSVVFGEVIVSPPPLAVTVTVDPEALQLVPVEQLIFR